MQKEEKNAQEEVVHYKSAKSGKICVWGGKCFKFYVFIIKEGKETCIEIHVFRSITSPHSIRKTE